AAPGAGPARGALADPPDEGGRFEQRAAHRRPGRVAGGGEVTVVLGCRIGAGPALTFLLAAEVAAASMRGDPLVSVRMDDPDAL
ncbi:hypothetical protein, partial [Brevibacterium rongguiense]